MSMPAALTSIAIERSERPDHVDVLAVGKPADLTLTPQEWAERVFSVAAAPGWVRALLGLRQAAVLAIGLRPAPSDVFTVAEVTADEALIVARDRHLDFWCAIGSDDRFVRMTTAVRLHGWRGRVYWSVVQFFHEPVSSAMLRRAVDRAKRRAEP